MRTIEEIELALSETQRDFEDTKEWYEKAYKKWESDVKFWGEEQSDKGDLNLAYESYRVLSEKITVLSWVLNK